MTPTLRKSGQDVTDQHADSNQDVELSFGISTALMSQNPVPVGVGMLFLSLSV